MSSKSTYYVNQLRKLIVNHFSLDDLQTLTFELGIDYDTIPGKEKNSKTRELIEACIRQSCLEKLVSRLRETRPKVDWPLVPENFDISQALKDVTENDNQPLKKSFTHSENPFLVGSAVSPKFFVGRDLAIKKIISRVGSYGGLQSLSLVANRSMGKTSLLKYVQSNYRSIFGTDHTYVAVYIDALDANAYTNADIMALLRKRIKHQTGHELWEEQDDGELALLSEGFMELRENQDVRLVLLLDEWEGVMTHPEVDRLLYALRANGSQGHIGMITATGHSLFELCTQGKLTSNFYNIFSQHHLNNFLKAEWESLVQEYYARSGQEPHWRDLSLIGELAGGHPYLTQLAGSLVWQAEQERWNDETKVRKAYYNDAKKVFWDIWRRLDEAQIQAIKNSLGILPFQEVPESVIDELKQRGVLTNTGEVFCQPFIQYAKQKGI